MKHISYVWSLVRFAFSANKLLYMSISISLFSVVVELLAVGSLLPLLQSVSGGGVPLDGVIVRALASVGIAVSASVLLWFFLILFFVRILTQLAGQSLSMLLGRRVMAQLGSRAFEQIITKINISDINKNSMGFYIGLAGDEAFRASTLIMTLTQFVSVAVLAVLYYVAIAAFSPLTAGVIVVFAFCSSFALYQVTKVSHRLGGRQTEESRRASSIFLDAVNNIKTVRAFSAEKYVSGMYRGAIFGYSKTLFYTDLIAVLTRLVPVLLVLLVFSLGLLLSSHEVGGDLLTYVITIIALLSRFLPTVGQGVSFLMRIVTDAKSGKDVTQILDQQSVVQVVADYQGGLDVIKKIELRGVGFSYDEQTESKILSGVNFCFEKGKSYAVVGRSGVGKSTLVDLLLKFHLPTSGDLCLNGLSISRMADAQVRRKLILVSQDAAIFDDTVLNNISMGYSATVQEIQIACKNADIHDVINSMAQGYNTRLEYQGKNLSGGQRQRIAIARALVRKPDVLIFDESTSALDKLTQSLVVGNILREYTDKIVIFVTHDPSIVDMVSEVIDLSKINLAILS